MIKLYHTFHGEVIMIGHVNKAVLDILNSTFSRGLREPSFGGHKHHRDIEVMIEPIKPILEKNLPHHSHIEHHKRPVKNAVWHETVEKLDEIDTGHKGQNFKLMAELNRGASEEVPLALSLHSIKDYFSLALPPHHEEGLLNEAMPHHSGRIRLASEISNEVKEKINFAIVASDIEDTETSFNSKISFHEASHHGHEQYRHTMASLAKYDTASANLQIRMDS
jgi:hypothetical protein